MAPFGVVMLDEVLINVFRLVRLDGFGAGH